MKKLPIGTQSFSILRKDNYLYVDKTKYIYKMIADGRIYFLSRPRRFGKSLLVSTLKELFQGNKNLFKGLHIHNKWDWNEKYPVIHLDFSGRSYDTPEILNESLNLFLNRTAKLNGITLEKTNLITDKFSELIEEIYLKTGKKVVVLIDEYDKPIISNLRNNHLDDIENKLGNFYEVLKTNDQYIQFIFITGISKLAHVSVFSKLNNLDDLSLVDEFNSICGYTQKELENNFQEYIEKLANKLDITYNETLDRIKYYYDGYSWNGKNKVYNPYSTLLCFKHSKFSKEWFNSGTPTVLANYPLSKYNIKAIAEPTKLSETEIKNPTTKNIKDEVFLFQTGYLTVSNIEIDGLDTFYTLKIPNYEVESALFENLIAQYSNIPLHEIIDYGKKLLKYLIEGHEGKIIETIGDYLSPIPSVLRGQDERYYHALIFRLLLSSKIHTHCEVRSQKGDADLIIEEKDYVIIVDFKQSNTLSIDRMIKAGFKQIEEKEYGRPYKNKKIIKGVIAFKDKEISCKIIKD